MSFLLNFLNTVPQIGSLRSWLSLLCLSMWLLDAACVKSVHSGIDDNLYVVKPTNGVLQKQSTHKTTVREDVSSRSESPKGSETLSVKTSVNNVDVLEQKDPFVASLIQKTQQTPDDPRNHFELASVYQHLRIFDKALSEYEKAIEFDPENPRLYEAVGLLWKDWRMPVTAIPYLERALELSPSCPETWNTLGTVYDQLGRFSEAQRCYLKALVLNPQLDFVQSNLCFSYLQMGEMRAAVGHCEMAVQLNPDLVEAHSNLGVAYGMADDLARAIEQFMLIGDEAEAHNKLGVLLLKKAQSVAALEQFKVALKLKPFYKVAAQNYNSTRSLVFPGRLVGEESKQRLAASAPLEANTHWSDGR